VLRSVCSQHFIVFVAKNQAACAIVLFSASDDSHRVGPFRTLILFRCVSDPSFCSGRSWLSVAALRLKSDHFYRIHKDSDEKDVYVAATDPGSILARATENDDRIILVAAAGGGNQAAAWTARVMTGLEEICAEKPPNRFIQSLKLLSGVSGGSVGIMYFVTACKLEGFLSRKCSRDDRSTGILQAVADVAKRSSLSEAIRGLTYTDFIRVVTPSFLTTFTATVQKVWRGRG